MQQPPSHNSAQEQAYAVFLGNTAEKLAAMQAKQTNIRFWGWVEMTLQELGILWWRCVPTARQVSGMKQLL
jgi:hypothetical protein